MGGAIANAEIGFMAGTLRDLVGREEPPGSRAQ